MRTLNACSAALLALAVNAAAPAECPADFNHDGIVDGADLGSLLAAWGTPNRDLNGDGSVDGADLGLLLGAWGECQSPPLTCASHIVRYLQDDGTCTVGVLASTSPLAPVAVNAAHFGGSFSVIQDPVPGTLIQGAVDTVATVTVQGINGQVESCTLVVTTQDITPPTISIVGIANGQEFVLPRAPSASLHLKDAITNIRDVQCSMELDGEPYLPGSPITEPGYHTLTAYATSTAGDGDPVPATCSFLVRSRPVVHAEALLESFSCTPAPDGFWTLDATVVVASHDFPIRDLDIATVALWPLDPLHAPLVPELLFVDGSSDPAGFYTYATAQALYQQGYWRLRYRAEATRQLVTGFPSSFRLTGRSRDAVPIQWDLECSMHATAHPDAINQFARNGLLNADAPAAPPAGDPCPPCEWKSKWDPESDSTGFDSASAGCEGFSKWYIKDLGITGTSISGYAKTANPCDAVDYGTSANLSAGGVLTVFLEGRKPCCQPTISVSLQPLVKTGCTVKMTGSATITPSMAEVSDCGGASATASGTQTLSVAGTSVEGVFQQTDLKSCNSTLATVTCTVDAAVEVNARKTDQAESPFASTWVKTSKGRIRVTPVCGGCANSGTGVKVGF